MATRMQQRRGTAATWTTANPILAAGEIGFETDTNKFKIGDGSNRWANLAYFVDGNSIIDGAPGLLNTLNELAAAVNDDPNFFATVATNLLNHEADATNVHGIANTADLVTLAGTQTLTNKTLTSPSITTPTGIVKADIGLGNVDNTSDADKPVSTAQAAADTAVANAASADATSKANAAQSAAESTAATALSTHSADTTNIHGIADTALLATKSYADQAETDAITAAGTAADSKVAAAVAALTKSSVGLANVDNTSDADKPVSTATQTELDLKAPKANPTFTGTVSGVTKSMVGLGNVDNTADADKPVSTATQTALDAKAPLASPALTGTPTAPTAVLGTNTTQVATTAFVDAAIEALASRNLVLDGGGV